METTQHLSIDGMTCGGCTASVAKVLKQIHGVSDAQVSLAEGSAVVTFDPARATPEQLKAAVEAAGFSATLG
jgi:copper chaperone CopZ